MVCYHMYSVVIVFKKEPIAKTLTVVMLWGI